MKSQIKTAGVLLVILWGFGFGMAQVHYMHKLEGRITYLNSGFKPVVGAQVIPDEQAHAKRTDPDGRFTLEFYRMDAGMEVNLRVSIGDLVVVNEKELSVTLKKDEAKQIKLFVCEKKQEISRVERLKKEMEEREENAQEQRRQAIAGLVDKARMCRADFRFDLATQCYEAAVKEYPGNFDLTAELASFLYNQNQLIEACPYYEKLLSLAESEADRANVLVGLGNVCLKNRQFQEALTA